MKLLCTMLMLLMPCLLHAQIPGAVQVGQNFTKEELDKAKKIVDSAKATDFNWKLGQFQVFQKGERAKGKLYWDVSDPDILKVDEIAPNTLFWYKGIRADTTDLKRWEFPPQVESYWVFEGIKEGVTKISIFGVSPDGKEVILVAKMSVTIGKPPKPVDPVDPIDPVDPTPTNDQIVLAARSDIKAGKGTANDVEAYASLYSLYAAQVKNGSSLVTVGDLYKEMNLAIDKLLGEDIEKTLPTLRKAVGAELRSKIPTNAALKIADNKTVISDEFLSISKRLQGVR